MNSNSVFKPNVLQWMLDILRSQLVFARGVNTIEPENLETVLSKNFDGTYLPSLTMQRAKDNARNRL